MRAIIYIKKETSNTRLMYIYDMYMMLLLLLAIEFLSDIFCRKDEKRRSRRHDGKFRTEQQFS